VKRALVVLNPTAAAGRAARELERLQPALPSKGIAAVVQTSMAAGHAVELARAGADSGTFEVIVAAGGDGTAREVASGVLGSTAPDTPVAVLPFGTGNDLAHVAGTASISVAWQAIAAGVVQPMDAIAVTCEIGGRTGTTHAMSFAAVGLAADVVRHTTPTVKRWFGPRLCYSVGFFRALARYRPVAATVECDGRRFDGDFLLICAGNTTHAGGQIMHLSPGADARDGELNLSLIRAATRLEVALQFIRLLRGTHIRHRRASYFLGRMTEVRTARPAEVQLDGDIVGLTPASFRILPGALRLVVGSAPD
jgi:diacylglycerol kinase (ATP)